MTLFQKPRLQFIYGRLGCVGLVGVISWSRSDIFLILPNYLDQHLNQFKIIMDIITDIVKNII